MKKVMMFCIVGTVVFAIGANQWFVGVAEAHYVHTSFNGLTGGNLNTQNGDAVGFGGAWDSGTSAIVAVKSTDLVAPIGTGYGLTQSGDPTIVTNLTTYARQQTRLIAESMDGTVFGSFLVKPTDSSSRIGIGFNLEGYNTAYPRIIALGDDLYIEYPGVNDKTTIYNVFTLGETSLVVFRIQIDAGPNGEDHLSIWINPDLNNFDSETAALLTREDANFVGSAITRLNVIAYSTASNAGEIDMVTLSNDADAYQDVTGVVPAIAYDPDPADTDENIGTPNGGVVDVVLAWKTGSDPSGAQSYNPAIKKHYLYMTKDQNVDPVDPNFYLEDTIDVTGLDETSDILALNYEGSYQWFVEEGLDDGAGGTYPTGDPNNLMGWTWAFGTILSVPDITDHPEDVVVDLGVTVNFAVSATSLSAESYQWYRTSVDVVDIDNDDKVGTDSSSLSITPAAAADEGYYYCVVTNDGGTDTSDTAKLGVRHMMAMYSMDQTGGYDGSNYLDTSTEDAIENHAALEGTLTPTFVTGADGTANGAVLITDPNSVANAGAWNPSEFTDQLTVSFWLESNGQNEYQGAIGKGTNFDDHMWYVRSGGTEVSNNLEFFSRADGYGPEVLMVDDDQWQLVVFTFDGTTAVGYVNGLKVDEEDMALYTGTDQPIWLGSAEDPASDRLINGALDDIRIYNYALTAKDVIDLYNANPALDDIYGCFNPINKALDLVDDCKIDILDFAALAASWLECGRYPASACN